MIQTAPHAARATPPTRFHGLHGHAVPSFGGLDIDALDIRVIDDDTALGLASAGRCASLPASTSTWLDGLLSAHAPQRR